MTDLAKLKERASEAFAKAKFAKAAELYEAYCKGSPKDLQSHLRMGDAFARAGNKPKAIGAYQFAAEGFAKDGFLPRAIAASKLILELDPTHNGVQQMLADLYARRGINEGRAPKRDAPRGGLVAARSRPDAIELPPEEPSPPSRPQAIELPVEDFAPPARPQAIEIPDDDASAGPKVIELSPLEANSSGLPSADELPPELAPDLQPILLDTLKKKSSPAPAPATRAVTEIEVELDPSPRDASNAIELELDPAPVARNGSPAMKQIEVELDPAPAATQAPRPSASDEIELELDPAPTAARAPRPSASIELELDPAPTAAQARRPSAAIELELDPVPVAAQPARPPASNEIELEIEPAPAVRSNRAERAPVPNAAKSASAPQEIELELDPSPTSRAAGSTRPDTVMASSAELADLRRENARGGEPARSRAYEIDPGEIELDLESATSAPPPAPPAAATPQVAPVAPVAAASAPPAPIELELEANEAAFDEDAVIERDRGNAKPSPPPAMPTRVVTSSSPTPPGLKRRGPSAAPTGASASATGSRSAANAQATPGRNWGGNGSELQASLSAFSKFDELELGDAPLPLTTETAPVLPAAPEPSETDFSATAPIDPPSFNEPEPAPQAALAAATASAPPARPKPRPAISFTELELSGDSLLHAVELAAQAAHPEEEPPEPLPEEPEDQDSGRDLPQIPLFSDLPPEAFIALFERCPLRRLREKERIIAQGSVGDAFYVICEGKVRVVREEAGMERELAVLEHGAFFGEMALLSGAPRTASVESAAEDTQLLEISAPVLAELSQEHPQVAQALKKFCRQRMLSNVMDTAPLFRLFNKKDRRQLVQRFRAREVNVDDVVIEAGQRSDGLYIVLSGEMAVRIGGRQVAKLKEGELFGEMSLLQKSPATASVVSTKRSSLLRLPREDFDELILSHPQILVLISELTDDRRKKNEALLAGPPPQKAGGEGPLVMV